MKKTGHAFGKLGRVLVENIVESGLGDIVEELRASTEEQVVIERAMQKTADRLWKEWIDKALWNAFFIDLPESKKLLSKLKKAVKVYYDQPADKGFEGVLGEILQRHDEIAPEIHQTVIGEYLSTLTEELLLETQIFVKTSAHTRTRIWRRSWNGLSVRWQVKNHPSSLKTMPV